MIRAIMVTALLVTLVGCGGQQDASTRKEKASPPGTGTLSWGEVEGWIKEQPTSQMRTAQYRLPRVGGDVEDALVAVFHFRGGGGSVQANLDRWIGQFIQPDGRPSKDVARISRSRVNDLEQTIIDLSGNYKFTTTPMGPETELKMSFRMLAAVVESESGPWFVKLIGPERTVAHWEASFYRFMKTFRESTR